MDDSYHGRIKTRPLTFIGPKGAEKAYRAWRQIFWPREEEYRLTFVEKKGVFRLGEVEIDSFEIEHVDYLESRGYEVKYGGKKIIYTGDIGSDHNFDDLVERVDGANLLITEASYLERGILLLNKLKN